MTDRRIDAVQDAVEQLADSVGPMPPPRGLKAGRRSGMGGVSALALLLAAAAATWWIQLQSPATVPVTVPATVPTSAPNEVGVVVEHLRIRGRSVQAKVERLPDAGAVMVTMAENADDSPVPEPAGEGS